MKRKLCTVRLITYEIKNICGNPFTVFFSTIFPILMSYIISQTYMRQVPDAVRPAAITGIFITMGMVVPMSIFLIGHGANYSQELEKDVPLRMNLFGFSQSGMIIAKAIANLIFLTGVLLIYVAACCLLLDILKPQASAVAVYALTLYGFGVIFFILSHGIATLVKKFGPTYAITMMLYFIFMIICGMMGIQTELLPKGMQTIAYTLPMTYVSRDFVDFWQEGSYNFAPFLQAMLFMGAVSGIVLIFSVRKEKRMIK